MSFPNRAGRPKQLEGRPMKCRRCEYEWLTKSESRMFSCPKCHKPQRNPFYIPKEVKHGRK